jgi:inner membrane transporter RhtA
MQIGVIQATPSEPSGLPGPLPRGTQVAAAFGRVPPSLLMLLSILSAQLGTALATVLFSNLGPAGTALLSAGFSAAILSALPGSLFDRRLFDHAALLLLFGVIIAAMLWPFFVALQYVPLGIASTIAFLGPLGLAVVTSRRLIHFLLIGIALIGIGLLTPELGTQLDLRGIGLAAISAVAWAGFVPVSKRAGQIFHGVRGLTMGLWAATVLLLPVALFEGSLQHGRLIDLAGALAVALMSTVLPMAMEFQALRQLSARRYGILLTLEPALSAIVGGIFLGQAIGPRMMLAIACVTIAAMGITLADRQEEP